MLLLCLLTGCWSGGLGYVSGVVRIDGQPLDGATLEFQPRGGSPGYGTTDAYGRYNVKATATEAGLPPGEYLVRIVTARIDSNPDGTYTHLPERLPPRYHEKSELKREVTAGYQTLNFDLDSAAADEMKATKGKKGKKKGPPTEEK